MEKGPAVSLCSEVREQVRCLENVPDSRRHFESFMMCMCVFILHDAKLLSEQDHIVLRRSTVYLWCDVAP